jgi:hypothetical protein
MNNEPVAWMAVNELNGSYSTFTNDQKQKLLPHISQCYGKWIPLYTHPVKDLTDEEIELVRVAIMNTAYWCADENMSEAYNAVKVCCSEVLAILRKAQEK